MNHDCFDVGIFTQADGTEERVFLRTRSHHQEKERLALQKIQHIHTVPAPRFLGMIQKEREPGTILLQSYMPGIDLANLLSADGRPPSPVAYDSLPVDEYRLITPIRELGKAIAQLHTIKTDQFGDLLPGSMTEQDGRVFTLQKVSTFLQRGLDRGWIHQNVARHVSAWIEQHIAVFPDVEHASLVHSDLHPGNIRVRQDTGGKWQFQGVIDFEHAKYWYPEYDLVVLLWHLGQNAMLWEAFLHGYGQLNPVRMQLFEVVKLIMIVSGHAPTGPYGQWAHAKLRAIQHELGLY